jgi:hypothetical protein
MTRTDTRRMLELERQRDLIASQAVSTGRRFALDAWTEIHGAELDALHALETADMDVFARGLPAWATALAK